MLNGKKKKFRNTGYYNYCPYHQVLGYIISVCYEFRDWVHDMNDARRINWADLKEIISQLKKSPSAADLGIVIKPLLNY